MTKRQKALDKFFANPESLKYREIEQVLIYFGFEKISTKGSHVKFKHLKLADDIIIPVHNGDCNSFYKKDIYNKIKRAKLE